MKENEKAATCTAEGSYDAVVYCTVCGAEQSRVNTPVAPLGHSGALDYTNNGDTHSAVYSECGCTYVTDEAHNYVDGTCACRSFIVGVANDKGVADYITLDNPVAIPGQDYVTTISLAVGTNLWVEAVYIAADDNWEDAYFSCIYDAETNTLTVRGEYVAEGMLIRITPYVNATIYTNGGSATEDFPNYEPDENGATSQIWVTGANLLNIWIWELQDTVSDPGLVFEREGYTLVSYNTAADGSGTSYAFDQKYYGAEDIDIYLIWECNHDTWLDATCTDPKTCATCGLTEGEALGHSGEMKYIDNGDTHSIVYSECGCAIVADEPHDFKNADHQCICSTVQRMTYTVEVYLQDIQGNYPENPSKTMTFTAPYGTEVDHYDDVQTPGFIVYGSLPEGTVTENYVMKVQMQRLAIQIQYRDEQDNIVGRQLIPFEDTQTLRTDAEVVLAKTGYTFIGWTTELGGDVVYGLDNLQYTNTATEFIATKILYPVYERNTYTVTFTVNGEVYDTFAATYGEKIPLPETDPEVKGYRFNGWLNVPETMPDDANLTIEADMVEQVTVTYLGYDDSVDDYVEYFAVEYDKGETITLEYYYWNYSNSLGWDTNDDGIVDHDYYSEYTVTEDVTMKPVLVPFYVDLDLGAEDASYVDAEGNDITRIYMNGVFDNSAIVTNHPTRPGYTFKGWELTHYYYGTSECLVYTNEETGEQEISLNLGVNYEGTAIWEANDYKLTFTINGEVYGEPQTFHYGDAIEAPAYEIPEGHTFSGWTVPETMPAENLTLDATLTANTYTVTWIADGQIVDTEIVEHGKDATKSPAVPEKIGYEGSWNGSATCVTSDVTISAEYEKLYYKNYSDSNGDGIYEAFHSVSPYGISMQEVFDWFVFNNIFKAPEGYHLSGMKVFLDQESTQEYIGDIHPAQDIYCQPLLEANTYTIDFDTDGDGKVDVSKTVAYGEIPEAPASSKADTAEWDYTFTGAWRDSYGITYGTLPAVSGDESYTAVYVAEKQVYTITWIIDGVTETTTVAYGEMPTHANPTKAATIEFTYKFTGWTPGLTAVTGDATYTAKFEQKYRFYTATIDYNGGIEKNTGKTTSVCDFFYNELIPLFAYADYATREGYTLVGWNTKADGSGQAFNVDKDFSMPAHEVTIYAQWKINEYTITFMDGDSKYTEVTAGYGAAITLPENPVKAGYTFAGWVDAEGNAVELSTMPLNGMTVYASWTADAVMPVVTVKAFSLSFEDNIRVNLYYEVSDKTDVVEQGMLVFDTDPGLADFSKADAVYNNTRYRAVNDWDMAATPGIAAMELGDIRYYAAYVKLTDGTYVYSAINAYSPVKYAMNMLGKSTTSAKHKALCVAMLNYGAAAQVYFGYNTDSLMNAQLTDAHKALVRAYDKSLFAGAVSADSSKLGAFAATSTGFTERNATVSFDGALAINYYFTPSATVSGSMKMYYWSVEDYAAADTLAEANATGCITMTAGSDGWYWAQVGGIAACDLDKTYYVCGVYSDADGNTYCTGVVSYSVSEFCIHKAVPGNEMEELASAAAMYGYYAKAYFG